jgi:hypothetical protein
MRSMVVVAVVAVAVASVALRSSFALALPCKRNKDGCLGGRYEETDGWEHWATCVCHGHEVLCCLTIVGAGLVEAVSGRAVCGCTPIFPEDMALRP